jgi:hypothetical protein
MQKVIMRPEIRLTPMFIWPCGVLSNPFPQFGDLTGDSELLRDEFLIMTVA